jgi:hypothetical protein
VQFMKEDGIEPNIITFNTLLAALRFRENNTEMVDTILKALRDYNITPDAVMVTLLLELYIKDERYSIEDFCTIAERTRIDSTLFLQGIKLCLESKRYEDACIFYHRFKTIAFPKADHTTINWFLGVACKKNDLQTVMDIFDRLESNNLRLTDYSLQNLKKYFLRIKRPELFKRACKIPLMDENSVAKIN